MMSYRCIIALCMVALLVLFCAGGVWAQHVFTPRRVRMCSNYTLYKPQRMRRRFLLTSPGYPYTQQSAQESVRCACRITLLSTLNNRIRIKSIRMEVANSPRHECSSEYVVTFGRAGPPGVASSTGRQCLNDSRTSTYRGMAFHWYFFDNLLSGVRGRGTVHSVSARSDEPFYLQCYNLLAEDATSNNSINMSNISIALDNLTDLTTVAYKRRMRTEKYHILFVFGLVTLGIFIVVLSVIVVYLGMLFAKRRFRSLDQPQTRRGHVGRPLYPLPTDVDLVFSEMLANRPPVRQPIAPPAYIEDPPKYETLFALPRVDSAPSDNQPNLGVVGGSDVINVHPLVEREPALQTNENVGRDVMSGTYSGHVEFQLCAKLSGDRQKMLASKHQSHDTQGSGGKIISDNISVGAENDENTARDAGNDKTRRNVAMPTVVPSDVSGGDEPSDVSLSISDWLKSEACERGVANEENRELRAEVQVPNNIVPNTTNHVEHNVGSTRNVDTETLCKTGS